MTPSNAPGPLTAPPLLAACREDQLLRLERLRWDLRKLKAGRAVLAVLLTGACFIALGELREPLQLSNQGHQLPNLAAVASCGLVALGWHGQRVLLRRLLKLRHQLGEELSDPLQAARESDAMNPMALFLYSLIPAYALVIGWMALKSLSPEAALFSAVSRKDLPAARRALQRGARTNYSSFKDISTLERAVWNRDTKMAALLLQQGADPEYHSHYPPLRYAVMSRQREMIRLMLPYVRKKDSPYTCVGWTADRAFSAAAPASPEDTTPPNLRAGRTTSLDLDATADAAEEPPFLTRAELSVMTGDVLTIRRELAASPTRVPQDKLLEIAQWWGTVGQLREAQRANASTRVAP